MDKFWSICAMPIGVFICFSPILIAWVLAANKRPDQRDTERRP